ncbi:hypothetical protein LJR220_000006 [Bradyrhizobium sp. LjRoot220]|uniref:hypothetical protein n=1 Tax=Bradyrhizobium sp. LjRoot220 TaxID=3342284 RepID=UPI003ECD3E8B
MLRMMLLGLLIPLGVGVLAAMELRAPARSAAVAVQPAAELGAGISEPRVAFAKPAQSETTDQFDRTGQLEKADRLDVATASSDAPAQPASIDERFPPPQGISVGPSEPPRVINRDRRDPKPKKVTAAAAPTSKPKKAAVKQATISERRKPASNTESCRLSAFGGLRRALGLAGCEI